MTNDSEHSSRSKKSTPDIQNIVVYGKATNFKENSKVHLHYLVSESSDPNGKPGFMAYGLEFGLNGWSDSANKSIDILIALTRIYLANYSDEDIFYSLSTPIADEFWALYRQVSFLSGDLHEKMIKENSRLKETNQKLREELADNAETITKITIERSMVVEAFQKMKMEFEASQSNPVKNA